MNLYKYLNIKVTGYTIKGDHLDAKVLTSLLEGTYYKGKDLSPLFPLGKAPLEKWFVYQVSDFSSSGVASLSKRRQKLPRTLTLKGTITNADDIFSEKILWQFMWTTWNVKPYLLWKNIFFFKIRMLSVKSLFDAITFTVKAIIIGFCKQGRAWWDSSE